MIVYLAAFKSLENIYPTKTDDIYLLSSFWEHKSGKFGEYVYQDRHILDSGAFSAINDKTGRYNNFDWDAYVKKYIAFIKQTNQKLFFELDIDCVVGLQKVEYYRKQIEDAVGRPPIPVWHSNRGADYFVECCEKYPYVALGTTTANNDGKKIRNNPEVLTWFINQAHKNGAKIHGLGFTSIPWLSRLKFDSVDSTTWQLVRYGEMCIYQNGTIKYINRKEFLKDVYATHLHNFNEWVKFQKYAEANL